MKKRLTFLAVLIVSIFACVSLSACGNFGIDNVDGTYYLYDGDELDKSVYLTLKDGQWSSSVTQGTYTLNGTKITFVVQQEDGTEEHINGTIGNGKLTISIDGVEKVFYMEGKEPSGDSSGGDNSGGDNQGGDNQGGDNSGGDNPGGEKHEHSFDIEWTFDKTHHWHAATCEHEDEKRDYAEHIYFSGNKCEVCDYEQIYNKILMLESFEGEADVLRTILTEAQYQITVVNIKTNPQNVPRSLEELANYDQVILVNISNDDLVNTAGMPEGFDSILNYFVYECGGGVFTVGGYEKDASGNPVYEDGKIQPHAYNRVDMANATYYADMLPVRAVEYTPPIGVMIIIDRSGSMGDPMISSSYLYGAKQGAKDCVSMLATRYMDYVGIMTLESTYNRDTAIMPAYETAKLYEAINDIDMGGGTVYGGAIEAAGNTLLASRDLYSRMHIILVSDGEPQDSLDQDIYGNPAYGPIIQKYAAQGISFSFVITEQENARDMEAAMQIASNSNPYGYESKVYVSGRDLTSQMIYALADVLDTLEDNRDSTEVKINSRLSKIVDAEIIENEHLIPHLEGFYGTRLKWNAELILTARYGIPLYAQHTYGAGKVGAFMSSLGNDSWSTAFMSVGGHALGQRIVLNIVKELMPSNGFTYCYDSYSNSYFVAGIGNIKASDIVIPDSYNGLPITGIADEAFISCTGLTSITLGNNITTIGVAAFKDCTGLTSITLGNNITTIGAMAFKDCTGLMSITFGNGIARIGGEAFYNCNSLTKVNISDLASWCTTAFEDCYANPLYYAHNLYINDVSVTEIIIPDSVTNIEAYVFYNCSNLEGVTIGNSVASIGEYAFYNCNNLERVTIGSELAYIGSFAFRDCTGIEIVYYKGTITQWGNISIGLANSDLTSAARYYYSEEEPMDNQWDESEHWWHYGDDGVTHEIWEKWNE